MVRPFSRILKFSYHSNATAILTRHKIQSSTKYSPAISSTVALASCRKYHSALTNEEIQRKRIELYDKEVKRQNSLIIDIEKIEVHYEGFPENCKLIMNKGMSTPYNCAQHIHKLLLDRSVLAEVDGEVWDIFRPLTHDCTLKFLHFKESDPHFVNKAFWRSMSLMLGSVLETSFNTDIYVQLCSFPPPKVRTGSFVYDISLPLESWTPNMDEMRVLSAQMVRIAMADKPFQRLEVDAKLALRMFEDNFYKREQIPFIASKSKSGNSVTLYRIGDFIDISRGPCISHTIHMGKCTIAAVIPINVDSKYGKMYRVQGVALPRGIFINHYSYSIIEERARKLNSGQLPSVELLGPNKIEEKSSTKESEASQILLDLTHQRQLRKSDV